MLFLLCWSVMTPAMTHTGLFCTPHAGFNLGLDALIPEILFERQGICCAKQILWNQFDHRNCQSGTMRIMVVIKPVQPSSFLSEAWLRDLTVLVPFPTVINWRADTLCGRHFGEPSRSL